MRRNQIAPVLLILFLSSSAWGEIYETTDEQGNTVFSDVPAQESQVVELPEANIADSVEPTLPPATHETHSPQSAGNNAQRQSSSESEEDEDDVYLIGDNYDERLEEKVAKEKRQDVLEGERPHEVLDAGSPRDMREADQLEHARPAPHSGPHVAPR